jgi:hypothetical protein
MCIDVRAPSERDISTHTVQGLQTLLRSSETDLRKLKAAFQTSKLWQTGTTITVGFVPLTPADANAASWAWKRAWVAYIIQREMAAYPNVTFSFQLDPAQHAACAVRIGFDETQGCWSRVGTDARQNWGGPNHSMNLGWMDAPLNATFTYAGHTYTTPASFDQGGYPGQGTTIVHEFGHVMGMIHEHQSPFHNPLAWNTQAVYEIFQAPPNSWTPLEIDENILSKYSALTTNGSDFDAYSIMKYTFPSSLLLHPTGDQVLAATRHNLVLSGCDKFWLATNYPGKVNATDLAALAQVCNSNTNGGAVAHSAWPIVLGVVVALLVLWVLRNWRKSA